VKERIPTRKKDEDDGGEGELGKPLQNVTTEPPLGHMPRFDSTSMQKHASKLTFY
jgi:hypothetical protein